MQTAAQAKTHMRQGSHTASRAGPSQPAMLLGLCGRVAAKQRLKQHVGEEPLGEERCDENRGAGSKPRCSFAQIAFIWFAEDPGADNGDILQGQAGRGWAI